MPAGQILYARRGGHLFIKLEGKITHLLAPEFDAFIEKIVAAGSFDELVVDLAATTSIDSTGLGLLAKSAKVMLRVHQKSTTLVSGSGNIAEALRGVGLDRLFSIVGVSSVPDADLRRIPGADVAREDRARTILEAHRELMALNEKNASEFRSVVEFLENELGG